MAEKIRVHTLARELSVDSKAILAKCKAEGVTQVKNHMSTLSIGLAETIREWFSEGIHSTVIEKSERVDLKKARKVAKKRVKKIVKKAVASTSAAVPANQETAVAVEDAPAVEDADTVREASTEAAAVMETTLDLPALEETDPELATVGGDTDSETVSRDSSVAAEVNQVSPDKSPASEGEKEVEKRVEDKESETDIQQPVKPAGPQNVPVPAQLKGPRVIRVERPDNLPPIRPSYSPSTSPRRGRGGEGSPPPYTDKPAEQRGGGGRGKLRRDQQNRPRANPRRSATRGSDSGERLREWRDRDLAEREERLRAASGRGLHARRTQGGGGVAPSISGKKGKVQLTEPIMLNDFSAASGIRTNELIKHLLFEHKIQATKNTPLDHDTAELLALAFSIELEIVERKSALDRLKEEFEQRERKNLQPRPPVVAFLGHVDHGKTSLLDAIRKTRVTSGESGGITQHIGAYRLDREGLSVTFLDTPGHEAFTAMRARGADMTDVVVLVIAADDGVMTQTIEAINHAKAAKVSIVVALNKIDLPGVDPDRILGQLSEQELVPTEWGGDVDILRVSATTGEGIDSLVQHLATLSELLELQADPSTPASGIVIEARKKEGVGVVASILVREGTLKNGDVIICGPAFGRVRSMSDDLGKRLKSAGPATPIELTGLSELPNAGDAFYQLKDLQTAKNFAKEIRDQRREKGLASTHKARSLEELFLQRVKGEIPKVNVILKADTRGSIDAIAKSLGDLPSDQVKLDILHAGVGGINEGDIVLAEASQAIVVGFHIVPESGVQRVADEKGVEIRLYRVIYNLIDELKQALEGKLKPDEKIEVRGRAEVREVFNITRVGTIAGCLVTDGLVARNHKVRLLRDSVVVRDDSDLDSLKRFKDDAKEVRSGLECGLKIAGFDDIKPGDVIEAYEIVEIARKL